MADELHLRLLEADLLLELAVQGLLGRLSGAHPALGKLPAAPAGAAAEEHLIAVHQHDADVAAKTVRIDDVTHQGISLPQGAPPVSPSRARFEGWRFPTDSMTLTALVRTGVGTTA